MLAIVGALLVGAVSPGPSFVFVVRTALSTSTTSGAAAAFGMGVGGLLYGLVALSGLRTILQSVPQAYVAFKVLGALYLMFLAVKIWRSARQEIVLPEEGPRAGSAVAKPFVLGLGTQLSNPKTALVYAGTFAAFLPERPSLAMLIVLPALILLVEAGWYTLVALACASRPSRDAYMRSKKWIDRAAGAVMGSLGVALLLRPRPAL